MDDDASLQVRPGVAGCDYGVTACPAYSSTGGLHTATGRVTPGSYYVQLPVHARLYDRIHGKKVIKRFDVYSGGVLVASDVPAREHGPDHGVSPSLQKQMTHDLNLAILSCNHEHGAPLLI